MIVIMKTKVLSAIMKIIIEALSHVYPKIMEVGIYNPSQSDKSTKESFL
jgi:hypothetical protein